MSTTGMLTSSDATASCPCGTTSPAIIDCIPTGSVLYSSFVMNTKAKRNSFQALVRVKSATASSPGLASGSTTFPNAWTRLQPSTSAASSNSTGIDEKYPTSSHVANGSVKVGYVTTRDHNESVSRAPMSIWYSGMNSSAPGIT